MKVIFLGTGASGGTPGEGKSHRKESSLFIQGQINILVDVTRHFSIQSKNINKIDCILLTHGHMDACGGISQLRAWYKKRQNTRPIPVYAHPQTIKIIQKKFKLLDHCRFYPLTPSQTVKLNSWKITPLLISHSKDPKFPTFAWKLKKNQTVIYASDIAKLTAQFKKFCRGTNLLIIDGATWKRKIYSHLRVDKDLPKLCQWKVGKIILTQIGRSAPSHEIFTNQVKNICPKAMPAYDGLEITQLS